MDEEEEDMMDDLSPETRELMRKVMRKKTQKQQDKGSLNPMRPLEQKQKQLFHMMGLVKHGIDSRSEHMQQAIRDLEQQHGETFQSRLAEL